MCGKIMIQSRSRQKKYIILNCNRKRLREKQGTSEEKQMLFSYFTALRNNLATREISESQNKRVKVWSCFFPLSLLDLSNEGTSRGFDLGAVLRAVHGPRASGVHLRQAHPRLQVLAPRRPSHTTQVLRLRSSTRQISRNVW